METCSERRKRKLLELAHEKGGLKVLAADCGLSYGSLDQIVKGVPLPAKADGTRKERSLGDDAARSIEARYNLGRGWFDSDPQPEAVTPENLEAALDVLTKVLQGADKSILIAVAPLLAAMASDPDTAKIKSELILKLMVADRDKSHDQTQYRMRQSHIHVKTARLTLGDDEDGRSNTDKAAGGGRKK